MSGLFGALNASVGALNAHSRAVETAGKNLANVNNPASATSGDAGGIGATSNTLVSNRGGEVVVTGASGGVGSIAVMVLPRLGFQVAASTGRLEQTDLLSARYDRLTVWPDGFDPRTSGAQIE